jgi:hypothetical protein
MAVRPLHRSSSPPSPARSAAGRPVRLTPSGSIAVPRQKARVARPSRIWVEGVHDAELLEKIWGDDLRSVGVVVEPLHGADDLQAAVAAFRPGPTRRLAVLLDHYVEGSKEWRIGQTIDHRDVLVVGHPFVDVWAAVRPRVVNADQWPDIPMGQDWKTGVCRAFGIEDPPVFWRLLLSRIDDWTDLDTSLINAVEQMIDFVTVEDIPDDVGS